MKKLKLTRRDYTGALIVLENFLDGALADYENGMIDNDALIEDCIEAIYQLGGYNDEYKKRYMEKKYEGKKED